MLAFDDVDAALDAVGTLRRDLDSAQALEFFLQNGLDLVCDRMLLARPFARPHEAFVLGGGGRTPIRPMRWRGPSRRCRASSMPRSPDDAMARALWRCREAHTEAINLEGAPHKLDVTLPADRLAQFVREVADRVAAIAPHAAVWLFGHG